jgi:nicotinamidase-related amidase
MLEKIEPEKALLIIIDVQEKFVPVIFDFERVRNNCRKLIEGAKIFNIPIIITEQYPKGLGQTIPELRHALSNAIKIEKTCFNCFSNEEFSSKIKELNKTDLIIAGIEAHVCVLKTVLNALEKNFKVHLIADAISSRKQLDFKIALKRMIQEGAKIASTEMILFQLLEKAEGEQFKQLRDLIK